jgi:hypothetical protein
MSNSAEHEAISGAEALALIAILANVLQLVDFSCQAFARIKECLMVSKPCLSQRDSGGMRPDLDDCLEPFGGVQNIVWERSDSEEGDKAMRQTYQNVSLIWDEARCCQDLLTIVFGMIAWKTSLWQQI